MKLWIMLISVAGLAFSGNGLAKTCVNANGSISIVNYDLTTTLTTDQNRPGSGTELEKSQDVNIGARCPAGDWDKRTYRTYLSPYPVIKTEGEWKYLQLDPDYIIGAMKIHDATIGDFYPPVEYVHMGGHDEVDTGGVFPVNDSHLVFRLQIVKPFIGTVVIPSRLMFNVYITTTDHEPVNTIVYKIIYSGVISVPQNCVINAGQTVTVDLGKLYHGDFRQAGQMPDNVRPKTFNVPVECNGDVESPAQLTLRLTGTADSRYSQALATDNPDVGVVVTREDGTPLTPNVFSSNAPFETDISGKANVTLQAYPISTTGLSPELGVFTALALLRIDFA
ncbi:fimbrial protein [Enterobacter bugandensis]|uniref:fimbrial protein n=1 Tax=Enterobacter bugandensis TaxID=881260 RepID=UPI002FCEFEA0